MTLLCSLVGDKHELHYVEEEGLPVLQAEGWSCSPSSQLPPVLGLSRLDRPGPAWWGRTPWTGRSPGWPGAGDSREPRV